VPDYFSVGHFFDKKFSSEKMASTKMVHNRDFSHHDEEINIWLEKQPLGYPTVYRLGQNVWKITEYKAKAKK
jgi:hypothetical protein